MHSAIRLTAIALVVIQHSSFCLAQGLLTPPGAPAPTMKTLDQLDAKLETRTPISSAPFTISASGSYYLAGNLAVITGSAITISADDVTLDLNGFAISSTASPASGAGVNITGLRRNVTVRNGHIRGTTTFAAGVFAPGGFLHGIDNNSLGSTNLRFTDVAVSTVGDRGINTIIGNSSGRNLVERCAVSICGGNGIRAGTVRGCQVETAGAVGITATVVSDSFGESVGTLAHHHGVTGFVVVENCRGIADVGIGVQGTGGQVNNSYGTSDSATGLTADCASNCQGVSTSGSGIIATNVLNSVGESTSGTNGINASVVSFCRAKRDGGVAITCFNAIGCSVTGTGTVSATNKSLGTP